MRISISRFTMYDGNQGNAVAFADVLVHENGCIYEYRDVKLYRDGLGLKISPKQIRTEHGWAFAYLIPRAFQKAIRRELVGRYRAEVAGQFRLALEGG